MKYPALWLICCMMIFTACTTRSKNGNGEQVIESPVSITDTKLASSTQPISQTQTPSKILDTQTPQPTEIVISSPTDSTIVSAQVDTPTTPVIVPNPQAIIIDHNSIALFEDIPEEYLTAARELNMVFSDRSVGQNINEGLECLTATSWESTRASCRNDYVDTEWNWKTFRQSDRSNGSAPARILFDPDPVRYNRDNWTFEFKQGTWSDLTQDFIEVLAPQYLDSKDVLSYQLTYLHVLDGEDIIDPANGYFSDSPEHYDIYDLEAFFAQHPDKTFFLWTTSLARSIGTETAQKFNDQMRQYALINGKILFDVADIESHTDQGVPCYDNRDGIEYCSRNGKCENYPDDGKDLPAICQDYTTETDGGHLGSVSAGNIQLAKAFWVLMARTAGWDGVSKTSP